MRSLVAAGGIIGPVIEVQKHSELARCLRIAGVGACCLISLLDLFPNLAGKIVNRDDREARRRFDCPRQPRNTKDADEPCDSQTDEHGIILKQRWQVTKLRSARQSKIAHKRFLSARLGVFRIRAQFSDVAENKQERASKPVSRILCPDESGWRSFL